MNARAPFLLPVLTDWQAEMRLISSSKASMSRMPLAVPVFFVIRPALLIRLLET
jgi:hypothetical protein